MAEGEELHVIELDQGDGWTRVRRISSGNVVEEGFVPTSYIESTLYAQVVTKFKHLREVVYKMFTDQFSSYFSVDHIYVNNV